MFETLAEQMSVMLFLILIGMVTRKKEIVTEAGKKTLSSLVINLILPCNIIHAYMIKLPDNFFVLFFEVLIITILNQIIALIITRFMYNRIKKEERSVYQYATICSNAGFMGNALADAVFGELGLLYASVFLIPQRIMMWTAGISFFEHDADKRSAYKKVLLHPCMIATYMGLIIMIFQIKLPLPVKSAVTSVSNCCTALTMMYIGMVLVEVRWKKLVSGTQLYYSFIRLVGMPFLIFVICRCFRVDALVMGVCVLLTGMPAGSTTAILAAQYEADEKTAVKCVVLSTALSIISTSLWGMLLLSYL